MHGSDLVSLRCRSRQGDRAMHTQTIVAQVMQCCFPLMHAARWRTLHDVVVSSFSKRSCAWPRCPSCWHTPHNQGAASCQMRRSATGQQPPQSAPLRPLCRACAAVVNGVAATSHRGGLPQSDSGHAMALATRLHRLRWPLDHTVRRGSPELLRKLKDPWPCRHELRSQVSAAINRAIAD